jgi:preprotein translocase subunit SecF
MTFGAVLVGSYTSIFIASPLLIYLGVGEGRAAATEEQEAYQGVSDGPGQAPAKR